MSSLLLKNPLQPPVWFLPPPMMHHSKDIKAVRWALKWTDFVWLSNVKHVLTKITVLQFCWNWKIKKEAWPVLHKKGRELHIVYIFWFINYLCQSHNSHPLTQQCTFIILYPRAICYVFVIRKKWLIMIY